MKKISIVCLLVAHFSFTVISCGKTGTATITNDPDSKTSTITTVYHFYDTITVDGRVRTYLINLPPNYDADSNFSLVVALHGLAGSARQMETDYKLTAKSNSAGFMIVYPEGVRSDGVLGIRTWNAGTCCDFAMQQNIDDVKFIRLMIQKLKTGYKINPKKVYATGMSNGAMMTYRLGCEMADVFAAIAPVSGTLLTTQPCNASRQVPLLHIHSAVDTKVPYAGGVGLAGYYFPPVDSALNVWSTINGCNPAPHLVLDTTLYSVIQWMNCSNNTTIKRYLTKDGGHSWPGGLPARPAADPPSAAFDATDLIWDFFQQYSLP